MLLDGLDSEEKKANHVKIKGKSESLKGSGHGIEADTNKTEKVSIHQYCFVIPRKGCSSAYQVLKDQILMPSCIDLSWRIYDYVCKVNSFRCIFSGSIGDMDNLEMLGGGKGLLPDCISHHETVQQAEAFAEPRLKHDDLQQDGASLSFVKKAFGATLASTIECTDCSYKVIRKEGFLDFSVEVNQSVWAPDRQVSSCGSSDMLRFLLHPDTFKFCSCSRCEVKYAGAMLHKWRIVILGTSEGI